MPGVARAALADVVAALPGAEVRTGQLQMVDLVEEALERQRHLVVQAGTGTGKTLGYLVPVILSGKRAVVATATKALQDQLAAKDLPLLEARLGVPFTWAVLKGRSNYLCKQRLVELGDGAAGQLELDDMATTTRAEISRMATWAAVSDTGDLAELEWSPSERAVRAVTVGSDECPGRTRCPQGEGCFAEEARERAADADVVVVNLHLYGLHVGSGGMILPDHEVLVVDEAHQLEDVMSATVGAELGPGTFTAVAAAVRKVLVDPLVVAPVLDAAGVLRQALSGLVGERLPTPLPDALQHHLVATRGHLATITAALQRADSQVAEVKQKVIRAQKMAGRAMEAIDAAITDLDGSVAYVTGSADFPRIAIAPLDVGPILASGVWSTRTALLTSATIPATLTHRVGLPDGAVTLADVGSPFDYEHHGLLYCALHLPDPRAAGYAAATHEELAALITAAGGRTLALFTSWKAMDAAAEAVRLRVPTPILSQRDLPKPALLRAFAADEATALFATAGFFQGVDIPGRTLSLVVIDRLPFPRPDDPLLSARREALGPTAFAEIDLPRAAMLLAQATGRLIRTATDRGVVAVLDRRLGTANYRWTIVGALPPMRRTRHRAEAEAFLAEITSS
jgi:ATP-dependent DNA helicase DinG